MSEPVKNPGQVPESYQPQKPEMMRALEEAQDVTDMQGAPQAAPLAGGSKIIPGLSKVDWSDTTRQNEFVWSVISALGALGEKLDYDYVCAVSGCAFRTFYDKAAYERGGYNHGSYNICFAMWTVEQTFRMLGYRATVHGRSDFETDKALIIESISKGVPVLITHGIIDTSDCCVLAGYDGGGDVILGYSAFMCCCDDFENDPSGYFRKSGWHDQKFFREGRGAIITIDEKIVAPSKQEVYRETLRTAIRLIDGSDSADQFMGLQAHTAYADAIAKAWQGDIGQAYFTMLCNRKMYLDKKFAAGFFAEMGNEALADIYRQIDRLVLECGKIIPHDFKHSKLLKKPKKVSEFCGRVLAIRDLEQQALEVMKSKLLGDAS